MSDRREEARARARRRPLSPTAGRGAAGILDDVGFYYTAERLRMFFESVTQREQDANKRLAEAGQRIVDLEQQLANAPDPTVAKNLRAVATSALRSAALTADLAGRARKGVTLALESDDGDLDIRFQFVPAEGGLTPDEAVTLALHLMRDPETR